MLPFEGMKAEALTQCALPTLWGFASESTDTITGRARPYNRPVWINPMVGRQSLYRLIAMLTCKRELGRVSQ